MTIEKILEANQEYSRTFNRGSLKMPPAKKLAVVACMDARLTVEDILGLETGDAHIIRNAGGVVTEDEIRSLIISRELLGTQEIIVINHTDCGMLTFTDEELRGKLKHKYSADADGVKFHSFKDLKKNVIEQVEKIKASPFIGPKVPVYGFIYHVESGQLESVL